VMLVVLTGCNHSDHAATSKDATPPNTATNTDDPIVAPKKHPDAMPVLVNPSEIKKETAPIHSLPVDGSATVLIFKTLQMMKDTGQTPEGFFMRGKMMNGAFQPSGTLEGTDKVPVGGTPGWVELNTGQFFPAMTSKAPAQPFIEGRMTTVGFFPSQPVLPNKK
jgi:hypothetical protein